MGKVPCFFLLLFALFSGLIQAQQFNFTQFTVADGLAQMQTMSILEDSRGYFWVGTYGGGVNRFDGAQFKSFTVEDGLSSNVVVDILEDDQGNIWFTMLGAGICRYDGHKFKCYGSSEGLYYKERASMLLDAEGRLVVYTNGEGLYRLENEYFRRFGEKDGLASDSIWSACLAPSGNIWLGTEHGLCSFNGVNFQQIISSNPELNQKISAVAMGPEEKLWLACKGGVASFKNNVFSELELNNALNNIRVKEIYIDPLQRLWFATTRGVYRYSDGVLFHYTSQPGLWENGINSIYQDQSGTYWICTDGDGLVKLDDEQFIHFAAAEENPLIYAVCEQKDSSLWIGTESGMFSLKNNLMTPLTGHPVFERGFILDLAVDSLNNTWVGGFQGLHKWDGNSLEQVLVNPDPEVQPVVISILPDDKGGVWIASKTGFYKVEGDSVVHLEGQNSVFSRIGKHLARDREGGVWMATRLNGIMHYDGNRVRTYKEEDGLVHNHVMNVTEDHNGNIWVGTYLGLSKFDGENFCYLTQREGLPANSIFLVQIDSEGNLWAGTEKGLVRIELDSDSNPIDIRTYGYAEGFRGIECNLNAGFEDSQGNLYVGNILGLTQIGANRSTPPPPPKVNIQSIQVFLEDVDWKSKDYNLTPWNQLPIDLKLPHKQNHLRFNFVGITSQMSEKVRYKYFLEGVDDHWLPTSSDNHAVYSNLSPGNYTFKVLASSGEGIWSKEPATFSFRITPPFWQQWWFITIMVILATGIFIFVSNLRTQSLRKQSALLQKMVEDRTEELRMQKDKVESANKAKSEFLATMSHEIRTPMNGVIGMTDLLMTHELPEDQKNLVENIRLSGQGLLSVINDILDFSRIESGKMELESIPFSIANCMEEIVEILGYSAQQKGLDLLHYITPAVPYQVTGDQARLRQILINLVGNAIKFTEKGQILVSVSTKTLSNKKVSIQFEVKDTGIGIAKEKQSTLFDSFTQVDASTTRKYGGTGLGLAISSKLAAMMGGKLDVESEVSVGTTFRFNIVGEGLSENSPNIFQELKGMHLVIASPHKPTLETIGSYCEDWGVWTRIAESAEGILSTLQSGHGYDTLVVDARMLNPELDLLRDIREEFTPDELALVVYGLPQNALQWKHQKESIGFHFLQRPFKPSHFANVLGEDPIAHPSESPKAPMSIEPLADTIPLSILVVDDNFINQEVARRMLEKLGYSPQLASNGLEAVEAVEEAVFDLVFMDVQMPEMDGIEATRTIISNKGDDRPKIMAMTANAMQGDREKYMSAGMDGYVSKPIQLKEIIEALKSMEVQGNLPAATGEKASPDSQNPFEQEYEFLDLSNLKELSGGDPEFMTAILSRIYEKMPESIVELEELYQNQQFEDLKKASHSLKSASGYTGCEEMKDLLQRIEFLAGSRNELQRIPGLMDQVRIVEKAVMKELVVVLEKN